MVCVPQQCSLTLMQQTATTTCWHLISLMSRGQSRVQCSRVCPVGHPVQLTSSSSGSATSALRRGGVLLVPLLLVGELQGEQSGMLLVVLVGVGVVAERQQLRRRLAAMCGMRVPQLASSSAARGAAAAHVRRLILLTSSSSRGQRHRHSSSSSSRCQAPSSSSRIGCSPWYVGMGRWALLRAHCCQHLHPPCYCLLQLMRAVMLAPRHRHKQQQQQQAVLLQDGNTLCSHSSSSKGAYPVGVWRQQQPLLQLLAGSTG